jgi:hypothetical protein
MKMDKVTLVTAVIFNADGETTSATVHQYDGELLEDVKQQAYDSAYETFSDDFYNPCGVIYYVSTVTPPKLPSATFTGDPTIKPIRLEVE